MPVLPDAYIIGAPKAGTTSLAAWLGEHPDGFMSTPKEPFYWASDYPKLRAHYGFATQKAYSCLFDNPRSHAATLRAEGSTVYLYSQTAVTDILGAVPHARFVVCLRNPADLLASYHRTQVVTLNDHETDFGRAWRLRSSGSLKSADPIDPKLVDYPMVGRLGAAVQHLLGIVPRERIHFVFFEDLVSSSAAVWHDLTDFLGLPGDGRQNFSPQNPSRSMYRSRLLREALHRPPAVVAAPVRAIRQWSRESDSHVVQQLKRATWRPAAKPTLSTQLRQELVSFFADDVRLLGELLGRDLQAWTELPSRTGARATS